MAAPAIPPSAFSTDPVARAGGLPGNTLLLEIGDSRTAQGDFVPTGWQRQRTNVGYQHWLPILSGGRCIAPPELNFGVAGDTTSQIVARLPAILAAAKSSGAATAVIHAGVNNVADSSYLSLEQTKSDIRTIVTSLLALGMRVLLTNEQPRNLADADRALQMIAAHEWMQSYARATSGVYMVDTWTPNTLPYAAATAMASPANYRSDLIHLSPTGGFLFAQAIVSVCSTFFPVSQTLVTADGDRYKAGVNPTGNLFAGMMQGTGGAFSVTAGSGTAAVTSGSIATGQTILVSQCSGLTITASKVFVGDYEAQRIAISGTPTDASPTVSLRGNLTLTDLAAGDSLDALVYHRMAAAPGAYRAATAALEVQNGTNNVASSGTGYISVDETTMTMPTVAWEGPVMVPTATLPDLSGVTNVRLRSASIFLKQGAAVNLTIDVARASVRKRSAV